MRLASNSGPPSAKANTEMAMNVGVTAMISGCPEPNRRILLACNAVWVPTMSSVAKIAQDR